MRRLGFAVALALAPLLAGCGTASTAQAEQSARPSAPIALTGRVVDNAGLLPETARKSLDQRLAALEAKSGPQMVIVTVSDLKGMTIEQLGLALGNGWGIGSKARNDGVLLIVAPNEHRTRIEVGKGLEATLTNPLCARIISEDMVPRFKAGAFEAGFEAGTRRIIDVLTAHPTRT
ncbi:YgcG family protein [Novosphingobium sp.]|uniref:TPM domain-containing protein n=1 Tax=Novosphingobium sp. TaxID=1874826 RepID=UPI0026128926|nr:TPM domain-containing protein [Novosphingobium sp.]